MKVLFYGFIVGLIVPTIGMLMFTHLPMVADVILMPAYVLSGIFDEPFWYLGLGEKAVIFALCGAFYSFVIGLIGSSPNLNN